MFLGETFQLTTLRKIVRKTFRLKANRCSSRPRKLSCWWRQTEARGRQFFRSVDFSPLWLVYDFSCLRRKHSPTFTCTYYESNLHGGDRHVHDTRMRRTFLTRKNASQRITFPMGFRWKIGENEKLFESTDTGVLSNVIVLRLLYTLRKACSIFRWPFRWARERELNDRKIKKKIPPLESKKRWNEKHRLSHFNYHFAYHENEYLWGRYRVEYFWQCKSRRGRRRESRIKTHMAFQWERKLNLISSSNESSCCLIHLQLTLIKFRDVQIKFNRNVLHREASQKFNLNIFILTFHNKPRIGIKLTFILFKALCRSRGRRAGDERS